MKKFLSMLLILCLFLGALPAQALAYVADNIQRADTVEQVSVGNSSLVLQKRLYPHNAEQAGRLPHNFPCRNVEQCQSNRQAKTIL